jgi:hypothetical protein
MTEAKMKRLIVAITVGAVLLITILCSVMVFGIIKISNEKRAIAELEAEIARYNQLIETEKDTYEARSTLYWIQTRAFELGYVLDDSINLG